METIHSQIIAERKKLSRKLLKRIGRLLTLEWMAGRERGQKSQNVPTATQIWKGE